MTLEVTYSISIIIQCTVHLNVPNSLIVFVPTGIDVRVPPEIPPLLVVLVTRYPAVEDLPPPLVHQIAERQEGNFIQGYAHQEVYGALCAQNNTTFDMSGRFTLQQTALAVVKPTQYNVLFCNDGIL